MEIQPLGDCALLLRLEGDFERAPEKGLKHILDTLLRLEMAKLPGVIELAPAYTTIGLFFDPVRAVAAGAPLDGIFDWLQAKIRGCLAENSNVPAVRHEERRVEIPVCYEAEFAVDLHAVAEHAGLTEAEVVQRHAAADYRVHCIGFTPGFPYLGGLPGELATPRRARPRSEVPAGSVAIGGAQTGIYPERSPGGWNLIGRTPLRLFDPRVNPPAILQAGDRVRFSVITRAEFDSFGS